MLNSGLYNYNQNQYQIPYTVPVHTPGAGIGEMANALVNGYLGYLQQSRQPTQLSGAVAQPNIFSALFGTQPPTATPAPSPSTDGGLY
jgi:hypothetical protein